MKISTKGRYALRVMVTIAEINSGEYIPLKSIAEKQDISQKYLENIMTMLSKANLVDALHGKGGGYKLCKSPSEYTVGEILRLTEGSLAPVACLDEGAETCPKASYCRTLPMWKELDELINNFFDQYTLDDLVQTESNGDYII